MYEAASKQTGLEIPEAEYPPFPDSLYSVWAWFDDLSSTRAYLSTMESAIPLPINFQEMQAYFSLYGIEPDLTQLDLIRQLDNVYLQAQRQ